MIRRRSKRPPTARDLEAKALGGYDIVAKGIRQMPGVPPRVAVDRIPEPPKFSGGRFPADPVQVLPAGSVTEVPAALRPMPRNVDVDAPVELRISPFHQFGAVCVAGTRIPADSLWGAVAAGDDVDQTADDFGVRRADVLLSCWWAAREDRRARPWKHWALKFERAAYGQRPDTVDWTAIPDPPEFPKRRR